MKLLNTIILFITSFFMLLSFKPSNIKPIHDFKLLNVDGKKVSLNNYPTAKGFIIVFTCNHCPFAKLYPNRLNLLNDKYKPLGIPLIAISSTDTIQYESDRFLKMIQKATEKKFNFPYLYDGTQVVAKNFAAQKTPQAFIIWKENKQWVIKYSGAIDDNGAEPYKVQNHFIAKAADELLSGKDLTIKETKSIGCEIHFRK